MTVKDIYDSSSAVESDLGPAESEIICLSGARSENNLNLLWQENQPLCKRLKKRKDTVTERSGSAAHGEAVIVSRAVQLGLSCRVYYWQPDG